MTLRTYIELSHGATEDEIDSHLLQHMAIIKRDSVVTLTTRNASMVEYFEVQNHGRTLRGMLNMGTNAVPVLMVHGYFSSNKIGANQLYVQIANLLANHGYSVLRIDLSGMGESDGDIESTEFSDHVSDVYATATKLMGYHGSTRIHYIAHSLGSCTVLQHLFENSSSAGSVTLISPLMPSEASIIGLLTGEENYQELLRTGVTHRKGLICRKSFIDATYIIDLYDKICQVGMFDSFVYFSADDQLASIDDSVQWATAHKALYKVIPRADHNFLDPIARNALLQELSKRFDGLRQ